jgi:proprotein convertase subtilisin/kexin type 2
MHARDLLQPRLPAFLLLVLPVFLGGCGGGGGGGSSGPAAPTNLVATVNGSNVDLAWTAAAGAAEYKVYYNLVPGVVRSEATLLGSVATVGALLTGQPSAKVHLAVTAVGPGGESALSNQVSAEIPPSAALDPLYVDAWHLLNVGQDGGTAGEDVDVVAAWNAGFDGTGIRIAIVDEDLEIGHEDLFWNCLPGKSHNYVDGSSDPTGAGNQRHGTSVGGVAAGVGANDAGSRGAAYEAFLVGYNFLVNQTTANEANAMTRDATLNAVSNNSWGPTPGLGIPQAATSSWRIAVQTGLAIGREGKGIVYLFAAGNGGQSGIDPGDNSNLGGYANFYGVIAVGAVGDDGRKASYSEKGANVLVCAPSLGRGGHGITTTDRSGGAGYNDGNVPFDYPNADYTKNFSGTSSSTPLVSGVVALVLEANPNLSWRDVRAVLAESARQNDAADADWTTNGAGLHVNHKYGFGVVDAGAATTLAQTWTSFGTLRTVSPPADVPDLAIPDNDPIGVTSTIDVLGSGIQHLEHVEIVFDAADHTFSGDLAIVLTSPSGTESVLSETHNCPQGPVPYVNWSFGSVRCLEEPADGTWSLNVVDGAPQDTGTFHRWSLKFRGH